MRHSTSTRCARESRKLSSSWDSQTSPRSGSPRRQEQSSASTCLLKLWQDHQESRTMSRARTVSGAVHVPGKEGKSEMVLWCCSRICSADRICPGKPRNFSCGMIVGPGSYGVSPVVRTCGTAMLPRGLSGQCAFGTAPLYHVLWYAAPGGFKIPANICVRLLRSCTEINPRDLHCQLYVVADKQYIRQHRIDWGVSQCGRVRHSNFATRHFSYYIRL